MDTAIFRFLACVALASLLAVPALAVAKDRTDGINAELAVDVNIQPSHYRGGHEGRHHRGKRHRGHKHYRHHHWRHGHRYERKHWRHHYRKYKRRHHDHKPRGRIEFHIDLGGHH